MFAAATQPSDERAGGNTRLMGRGVFTKGPRLDAGAPDPQSRRKSSHRLRSDGPTSLECTVAIIGVQQSLIVNLNQFLSLHTGDVLGNVTITQNSMPRRLAPIVIGDIAGNLTITNNHGVSNTDAHAFADGRTVVGTVTISGNTP